MSDQVGFEDEWGPGYRRLTIRHPDGREETREIQAVSEPSPRYGRLPYRSAVMDGQTFGLEAMNSALARDLVKAARAIDELRAILAPLLDDPMDEDSPCSSRDPIKQWCSFCGNVQAHWGKTPPDHEPTCPVLRRDELLGRTR